MREIKCDACHHINREGTELCESCGKPLVEKQQAEGKETKKLLNMRYDGSSRRSMTYNKSVVDRVWNFFSSVKVGVTLIVITLIASAVGTILPQQMYIPQNVQPEVHYKDQYGLIGQIYYQLGLHELYSSWWYMILIALIGISIIIASIDRVVPLYRALKNQKPTRHTTFIQRQRLHSKTDDVTDADKHTFISNLKRMRYKVTEDNGHVLAEKGRFSRWGPYVNHVGLIIFLLGALLRFVPFMYIDDFVWVREGETVVVPDTNGEYFIENKDFIIETYGDSEEDTRFKEALENQSGPIAKNFQTNAVIYRNVETVVGAEPQLEKFKEDSILVNHALKFDGFALYQTSYQLNEFKSMSFIIHETNDADETELASFKVDLTNPAEEYQLDNGFRVMIDQYFPDYYIDDGEPRSQTKNPKNPAFVFLVYPPDSSEPEVSFAGIGRNVDASGENQYKVGLQDFEVRDVTGLTVRKDYTLPILGLGGIIFMIGVIQGMYWQHRRVWIHPKNNGLWLAAHTNKNWFGIKKDIEKAIMKTNINMVVDQEQEEQELQKQQEQNK
ncbi:cytochrome c biogenesis protein ResB [Aquibacillus rhizosphaerae]|uniref:Cytochrome c biogenesis protein ResB n=1 Tax=Aquibacillus rhizosphaerae TaxID=3051431 RepID=A0ABT7L4G4_9BACI|nr:cytochrome c biogenesis protein ResB [Aquibacillus sp. LR5S19]MDL4840758.1 cytochrome c biogenesis protein ResB [Aquibacillus sp. LR5S19]